MDPSQPPRPIAASDALEFELTDISDAKHALEELPPGVGKAETLATGYWLTRRRKPVPTDRALTGAAIDWLLGLPPGLRPNAMCERFPRVVNAIAEVWARPDERRHLLDRLLTDDRGRREGFPLPVRAEIEALRSADRVPGR